MSLSFHDILYLVSHTFIIIILSFIHPWLVPNVDEKTRKKMRNNILLIMLFVFSIAFSQTQNVGHSLIILTLYFFLKRMLLKFYQ